MFPPVALPKCSCPWLIQYFLLWDRTWDDSASWIYTHSPPTHAKLNVPIAPQTQHHLPESMVRSQQMCPLGSSRDRPKEHISLGAKLNLSSSLPFLWTSSFLFMAPLFLKLNLRISECLLLFSCLPPLQKSCCGQWILLLTAFPICSFYSIAAAIALVQGSNAQTLQSLLWCHFAESSSYWTLLPMVSRCLVSWGDGWEEEGKHVNIDNVTWRHWLCQKLQPQYLAKNM